MPLRILCIPAQLETYETSFLNRKNTPNISRMDIIIDIILNPFCHFKNSLSKNKKQKLRFDPTLNYT
jgi:hypothetical protein